MVIGNILLYFLSSKSGTYVFFSGFWTAAFIEELIQERKARKDHA
jgi:hypothetical protein